MEILIVDDSRTMRKIIRKVLEGSGYSSKRITDAADGCEALSVMEAANPPIDLVLADWNMPNMDGLELLKRLKASERFHHVPVIMTTGEAERDRVVEAINAGARSYVVKPFAPETLRKRILTIETELMDRAKPTDTAIFRFSAPKSTANDGSPLPFLVQLPEDLLAGLYEEGTCKEYAAGETVYSSGDVVDALLIVDSGEIETAGVDSTEPVVFRRGECFGEVSFMSGDPTAVTATVRDDALIIVVNRPSFERLMADHPHLSFFLTRLLAKRAKDAAAPASTASEGELCGQLKTMPLAELVQTLHNSKATGTLRLRSREHSAYVSFSGGDVRDAHTDDLQGEEAFYPLLGWRDGSFTFEAGDACPASTVSRNTMGLIMEGLRRLDETRQARV